MRIINFIFVVLFFNSVLIAQNYSIFGKIDDMPDGEVLLGYYYGDKQFVKDTVNSHHGFFHFESEEELESGMYFVLLPNKQYFQLIIDETRNFSFETSQENMILDMKVQGSKENQLFYEYQKFTQKKGIQAEPLKKELNTLEKNSRKYEKIKREKQSSVGTKTPFVVIVAGSKKILTLHWRNI